MKCFPHSIICEILDVWGLWSGKECPTGREDFIDVRIDPSVDVSTLGLRRIGPVVVEIGGEVFPPQYNLRNVGCWRVIEWQGVP